MSRPHDSAGYPGCSDAPSGICAQFLAYSQIKPATDPSGQRTLTSSVVRTASMRPPKATTRICRNRDEIARRFVIVAARAKKSRYAHKAGPSRPRRKRLRRPDENLTHDNVRESV